MKKQLLLAVFIFGAAPAASALQEENLDVNGFTAYGYTQLYNAALTGDNKKCAALLDAGARINDFTKDGNVYYGETPLQGAAGYGRPETCEFLLQRGADINATRSKKSTPLFIAAGKGDLATIAVLLKYKERINTHYHVWTPLHEAAKEGHCETCELLIQNRANLNITQQDIKEALALLPEKVRTCALLSKYINSKN